MANDRWTPTDGPSKGDKYEWRLPANEDQHGEQTVAPGDLRIKPKDLSLIPTKAPKRSGVQWGADGWDFENQPDSSWYVQTGPIDVSDDQVNGDSPLGDDDTKALDFTTGEHLRNETLQSIGIADTWSVQVNYEPNNLVFGFSSFGIGSTNTAKDQLRFDVVGSAANDPLRISLTETNTTIFKQYDYEGVHSTGVKISVVATWNGTDLIAYINGVETEATTKTTDNAGTMVDTDRAVVIGGRPVGITSFSGKIHSVSVWNVILTQAEVTTLQNSGSPQSIDNRFNVGNYDSANSLQHYWRCGFDANALGKDYGNATNLIDVFEDAANITSDDIVDY